MSHESAVILIFISSYAAGAWLTGNIASACGFDDDDLIGVCMLWPFVIFFGAIIGSCYLFWLTLAPGRWIAAATRRCKPCGARMSGEFCARCGAKGAT